MSKSIAIVGSGPAGLMAADVVSSTGHAVTIFEKRPGPARKLFIAGSSGLNITNNLPLVEFAGHYSGERQYWENLLIEFGPRDWIQFIEQSLDLRTFEGTSGRYFVENMKAVGLVRAWKRRLVEQGVEWRLASECTDFNIDRASRQVVLSLGSAETARFDAVCFALGGGSYEPDEVPLRWPQIFVRHDISFAQFAPSNVGYLVAWKPEFLREAEGLPLKNIRFTSERGSQLGDLMVTSYGIEGTPVYSYGRTGTATLDLKPDLSVTAIVQKLMATKENLSPLRRVKKYLKLPPAALALLYHHAPATAQANLEPLVACLKSFPLHLLGTQSLAESISSAGGVSMREVDDQQMLRKHPGVFLAGEMLDWDAPTGGFLIQACVSQGYHAGIAILDYVSRPDLIA